MITTSKTIEKKILPQYYKEVVAHRKMFELRKDEDDIQTGDWLILREWDGEKYTGHQTKREVTYVLRNCPEYGLADGFCVISMQVAGWDWIHVSDERVVRCENCKWWKADRVRLPNGRERKYLPDDVMDGLLGRYVSCDVGINMGAQCFVEYNRGWDEDKTVFRNADDYCSRGETRPVSYDAWWGIDENGFYPES